MIVMRLAIVGSHKRIGVCASDWRSRRLTSLMTGWWFLQRVPNAMGRR